jgi:hypothetical protein
MFGTRSRRTRAPRTTHTTHTTHTTTTTAPRSKPRRGLFSRRPVRQQRKPTMKDKVSGAFLKLRGSLTGRPGMKVRSFSMESHNQQVANQSVDRLLALAANTVQMAAVPPVPAAGFK